MAALIVFLLNLVASLFKPKSQLEAENAALRQQLIVLQRKVRGRVQFTNSDRLFIQLYRWFPSVLKAMRIMRPETVNDAAEIESAVAAFASSSPPPGRAGLKKSFTSQG